MSLKDIPEAIPGLIIEEAPFSQSILIKRKFGSLSLIAFFVFFSGFWNLVSWSLMGPLLMRGEFNPLMLTHLPVGLGTAYFTFCLMFNIRYLRVNKDHMAISVRPLPWWPRDKKIPIVDIKGFTSRRYVAYQQNDNNVYKYKVIAIKSDSTSVEIIRGLGHRDEAFKVETLLEKYYRIEDNPAHDVNDRQGRRVV